MAHAEPGAWLIFADAVGLGKSLAERLRARGDTVTLVYRPALDGQSDGDVVAEAVRTAFANQSSVRDVVYLWALDEDEDRRTGNLDAVVGRTCGAVLEIVSGLVSKRASSKSGKLWLVTRGAQAIEGRATATALAPLWGLGGVVAREHPELGCVCVDLDPARLESLDDVVWQELGRRDVENRVAFRWDRRLVARLNVAYTFDADLPRWPMRDDRTYLITGGTGALGGTIARHLVQLGARTIVLTGRRDRDAAIDRLLGDLSDAGAQATYLRADVSRGADVDRMFGEDLPKLPPLAGIVHAAGVLDDALLAQQTRERFARVLAPKAIGAWHLHRASKAVALDFFLMFSSAASIVGTPGQANYAAANAFLDALALTRRCDGLPATTINWGPWAEGGMAAALTDREHRRWNDAGIRLMPTELALAALDRVMASGREQSLVMLVDWARFAAHAGAAMPLLADFVDAPSAKKEQSVSPLRVEIGRAAPNRRKGVVAAHVREQVRRALGLDASDRLDGHQGLRELGMDSLMAVDLRQALQQSTGETLSATIAFDYPTIDGLTDHLATLLIDDSAAPTGEDPRREVAAARVDAVQELEELSDEEVDRLFAEKIAAKGI